MSENGNQELEIDFSKIDLVRGKTPEDVKQRCFQLCRDYLSGVWLQLTVDDIEFRRLSGGLTNQLYYCAISEDKRIGGTKEPQEVAIRLYEPKHFNNYEKGINERLTDTIIALMVSENGLGPKIFGLFETGQIQSYYQHKQFRKEEQNDPKMVDDLARRLARVHAMDVPIKKTGNWIFETFDNFYNEAETLFDLNSLYEECKCETFKTNPFPQEMQWLKDTIVECNSPINFTHVDFRGSNIMITEKDGIVLCDFEYSCYGFRGVDFGTIFFEWGQNFGEWMKPIEFSDDLTLSPFIEAYIEESIKLRGNQFASDKRNTLEHILKESKVFSLVSCMFFVVMILKANESIIPDIPFDKKKMMMFCEICYQNYHRLKQQFIHSNVFSESIRL